MQHKSGGATFEDYRKVVESRLENLLQAAPSPQSLDKVLLLIFESEHTDFRSYLSGMAVALNCGWIGDLDDAAMEVMQDAWNYFPHRSLGGRCPAELIISIDSDP